MRFSRLLINLLRFVLPVVGVLLLLAVIIFFAYFDSIAQYALNSASNAIPGRLKVKRFSPTWSGVQLEGVRWDLGDKDPFFVADRVDVSIDHTALLRRDWLVLVRYARVVKPGLRVVVDPEGNLNLTRLLESREAPQTMDINRLRMVVEYEDGWILYNDRRQAGFLYELSDVKGTAAFPDGSRLLLKTNAQRKEDASKMAFEGEVSLGHPRINMTVDLQTMDLLPFAGHPGFGPGQTLVKGTVSGSAVVQGSADQWSEVPGSLFMIGKMELADGLLATPWLPVDLGEMKGTVSLLGREVSTEAFQGKAADIPFKVKGSADLEPDGELDAHVSVDRFSLEQLKPYMTDPPDVHGEAQVEVDLGGTINDPGVSGTARGYNLSYQGQTVPTASADFLRVKDLVHLSKVVAQTSAGKVTGEGWLFLDDKPRVLLALQGDGANPAAIMPDLAQSADFRVRVLGEVDDPVLFGQGELRGLGSWAQGASSAVGSFFLKGRDLMLIDGLAFKGGSTVNVPVAAVDLDNRQVDAVVSTQGFSLSDLPGVSGISGQVSGTAIVSADLSGETPRLSAQGVLTDGTFASGGYQASGASGAFSFDGNQMVIPDGYASFEGSRVNLAGVFDLRNQALDFSARSDSLNLAAFGLPGESAAVVGSISGQLGGQLGVYGYAASPRGRAALSGFQRGNGTVGGVAWVDGGIPGQKDSNLQGVVVAGGTPSRLNLEYTGQAVAPAIAGVGPLDLYGAAMLQDRVLTVRPTLLAARDSGDGHKPVPLVTYSGAAYPFFGPLLAGPLKKVVVQESHVPSTRSLSISGKANLANHALNMRFDMSASGLEEFANQPLGSDPDSASLNETLPFNVLSGFGTVTGAITGTFGSPRIEADYNLPWLLLANGYENRQAMSSKGRVTLAGDTLKIGSAAVSETPFDARLRGNARGLYDLASKLSGLLAVRGQVEGSGQFDLRVATAGFKADFLALVAPQTYRRYLPYGRLATENLHIWGSATNPSLAGAVQLIQGGIYLAGAGFPFQTASLSFSSQGGETRVEDLVLQAPGMNITGYGKRGRNGDLSGEIAARDIDLEELHRLGPPFSGLSGRADAVVQLQGKLPRAPRIEVAVRGENLLWNPEVIGGLAGTIPIEELALGEFSEDGNGLKSGLTISTAADGVTLELPPSGLRFRLPDGGLSLEAEGAVRFPGGFPDLRTFKTFSDYGRYFASSTGPDFGRSGAPFRASAENWSFAQLSRLLGRPDIPYRASGTASVALQGQWWRDHMRDSSGQLPSYSLDLASLSFEGDRGDQASGFELNGPASVRYQREGDAGYLSLIGLSADFFSKALLPSAPGQAVSETVAVHTTPPGGTVLVEATPTPPPVPSVSSSPTLGPPVYQGLLEAEARLALAQLPGAKPLSNFHLGAVNIPLTNLAFMLPQGLALGGLVDNVELNLNGLLPTPHFDGSALVTQLSLGPIQAMTFQGKFNGDLDENGGYRMSLGDANEPLVTLSFGSTDAGDHQLKAEGSATLLWKRTGALDPDRLSLFSKGLELSPDSPLDLAATIVDKNLRIIEDALPGKDQGRGEFSASLSVDGTLGYPEFEGQAKMTNGSLRTENYGNFENLQMEATVERISPEDAEPSEVLDSLTSGFITRFRLPRFEGTLGKKPFFASGHAEFAGISPTFMNLFFVGEALPLQLPDLFTGTADVDMELRGRMLTEKGEQRSLSPVVLGTVVIPKGDFEVPTGAVEGAGASFGLPVDYDVTVDLGQEFYAHMYGSTIRAVGEVRLLSEKGKPQLYGRVDLSRGQVRIPFYDASFRVRQGVAYFEGSTIPRLENVEAVADLGGYRIVARVDGTYPDKLTVNLFSDPPLPQAELSRLVVLGGLPGQFSGINDPNQGGSSLGTLSGTGVSFLSGILTNRLTEQIGKIFLLSEVSFDFIPPAQYVIKLAKALDPNDTFLLTLTRVFRDNGLNENLYGIEWRLSQTFLTRIALDQYNQLRFWIQSINRF